MTPELYMYKNREGGLIVLYSNDDAEACQVRQVVGSEAGRGEQM